MKSSAKYGYILLLCVSVPGTTIGRDRSQPTAKFSFNHGSDQDEVSGRKAKLVGVDFFEDRFGNEESAVFVSGSGYSYVNLGNYPALRPRAGSISLWVKMESTVYTGKGGMINPVLVTRCAPRDDFNESYFIYYVLESGRMCAGSSRDSLAQVGLYSTVPFSQHKWHHLVISYDDTRMSFFMDGRLESTKAKMYETVFDPLDSVLLGVTGNKKNLRYFIGIIDDVEFYDQVLSGEEVLDLYHAPDPNQYRIVLNGVLVALCFVAIITLLYFFIRYRLGLTMKRERQELELHNLVLETELRVNKALMNPHFVFNSLNALQNFILKDQNRQANNYLVKFSKLLRRILESNLSDTISLEFEIELLNRYLEIEDLRFEENIRHRIMIDPAVTPSAIKIPVMLLQPFVENSLWHGLLKKKGEKLLAISFSMADKKHLLCVIEDNGVGRKKDEDLDLEKSSLAIGFIRQRLKLLNRIHLRHGSLEIIDKPDAGGTIVRIVLPVF